jgi:hypothetical protein
MGIVTDSTFFDGAPSASKNLYLLPEILYHAPGLLES